MFEVVTENPYSIYLQGSNVKDNVRSFETLLVLVGKSYTNESLDVFQGSLSSYEWVYFTCVSNTTRGYMYHKREA